MVIYLTNIDVWKLVIVLVQNILIRVYYRSNKRGHWLFFCECDFNVIEAVIPSKNIASVKLAENCNIEKEAVLKNRYKNKVTNEINDLYIYSIFKEDYI